MDALEEPLRVLMVGDQGCGKSSLIHWLEAGGAPKRPPRPTVGCNIAILESFGGGSSFLVELREVGGHGSFASAARSVFYRAKNETFDAVIIVYDLGALGDDDEGGSSSTSSSSSSSSSSAWNHHVRRANAALPERAWIRRLERASDTSFPDDSDNEENGGKGSGSWDGIDEEGGFGAEASSPSPPLPPFANEWGGANGALGLGSSSSSTGNGRSGRKRDRVAWVQRPQEGPLPLLVVANKLDLLLEAPPEYRERFGPSSRDAGRGASSHRRGGGGGGGSGGFNDNGAVFVSALDPHLDTAAFHDFFLAAHRHKMARQRHILDDDHQHQQHQHQNSHHYHQHQQQGGVPDHSLGGASSFAEGDSAPLSVDAPRPRGVVARAGHGLGGFGGDDDDDDDGDIAASQDLASFLSGGDDGSHEGHGEGGGADVLPMPRSSASPARLGLTQPKQRRYSEDDANNQATYSASKIAGGASSLLASPYSPAEVDNLAGGGGGSVSARKGKSSSWSSSPAAQVQMQRKNSKGEKNK